MLVGFFFCVKCGGERYSRQREGSGAIGARVLSFMRFALSDGFRPQSGLVQREYYMSPPAAALPMAAKTYTTGLAPAGNAPLLVLRTTFPPEGELYLPLNFYPHKQFKV